MKNTLMRKRIASLAAAAVMSLTSVAGTFSFAQLSAENGIGTVHAASSSVTISKSRGYQEGAYVEWAPVSGATGYNVYCDGVQLDSMLIRQYAGYFRADAVGLKAGSHTLKVVPVSGGTEITSAAATANVTSTAHDRSGFAFVNGNANGAYNSDGTLKSNAVVVYVTEQNKDSVTASLNAEGKGNVDCVGIQAIITAYKKGKETRPIAIRCIGNITDPSGMSKGDLLVDGAVAGMTIEGIGNDTTFNGFGLVMKNSSNVEVRNIGFMNCNSSEGDNCGLQQKNDHVWVHNCDFFYGDAGTDADQAKGDGALDTKTSTYVTHSYNHFFDNGKCNLQGMKSETTENYVTYHHNWYDHSDSRHPRIRTCSVHIYNNYYDGNSKYGAGVTMGASAFVEKNYFRNCKYPMLISMQGSDMISGGIFSGEAGGVIKAFDNYMTGQKAFVPYSQNNTDFDAYVVSSASEKIPSNVTAKSGGTSYNNFDTSSVMYSYTADSVESVPEKVMANAGRVDGGDFKWTFNNSVDDESYDVNSALKSALVSYDDKIIAIGSGFSSSVGNTTTAATTSITTTSSRPVTTSTVTTGGNVTPSTGSSVHNFTENDTSSSFYTISGNLSTSKGTVSYDGKTLTQCLKMESTTSIAFNASSGGKLTLVFAEPTATVKVDGTKYTASGNGIITVDISAGSHTITKADTANLFYMVYSGSGSQGTVTTVSTTKTTTTATSDGTTSTTTTTAPPVSDNGEIKVVYAGGWNEMAYMVLSGLSDSAVKAVSFNGPMSGSLTGEDLQYLVRDTSDGLRVDLLGLKPGTYSISLDTTKGKVTQSGISVSEQDRSGYAHYNYTEGVGAYNDDGTLKTNAKVLYVTEENKNTVTVTSKDGTTVKGIGNILNSAGMDAGGGKTSKGGAANSNSDIIKKLAQDGTPLVVRIVGNVTAPQGVTVFDSLDMGGSVGDNGGMARMKSGKNITIEGVGNDATVNGWGFHFMASSSDPDFGKSFEVRNITFRNVPEDCIGMEGVQSNGILTASVERCWIHNCEFYVPHIDNPAESDKAEGDGACDFKRGQYFTNSYCYYEGYHKTNLVGSDDESLQYHLTYHHNYWKNCESRGPLARQADIHMYNNVFEGQTSYCQNPRANAYIFSEYNVMKDSKSPVTVKSGGVVKSFNDVYINVKGDQQASVVNDRNTKVSSDNKYANFDMDSSVSYVASGNYSLTESTGQALYDSLAALFEADGGCMDNMKLASGGSVITPEDGNVKHGDSNCDGKINLADAVLIMQVKANPSKYTMTAQGEKNADCSGSGDGVTNKDALAIQRFLLGILTSLPEA